MKTSAIYLLQSVHASTVILVYTVILCTYTNAIPLYNPMRMPSSVRVNSVKPELIVQTGHTERVSSVVFSPDGKSLFSGSFDQTIKQWDMQSGLQINTLSFRGKWCWITSIAISPDGKLLASASGDNSVILWSVGERRPLKIWSHSSLIYSVAFSPSQKWLACGGDDGEIFIYNLQTLKRRMIFYPDGKDTVTSLQFSPDNIHIGCAYLHGGVKLWNIDCTSGKPDAVAYRETWVSCISFSNDGMRIFAGFNDGSICSLSSPSLTPYQTIGKYENEVSSIGVSPSGSVIIAGFLDGSIRLIDLTNSTVELRRQIHGYGPVAVCLSSDGKQFASGGADRAIRIWSFHLNQLQLYSGRVASESSGAFSPKNSLLATGNTEGIISLWDMRKGCLLRSFHGPKGCRVNSCAFDTTGSTLATGFADGWLRFWNIENGRMIRAWKANQYWVTSVAYQPQGKLIATGGSDGSVKLWDLRTGKMKRDIGFGEQTWALAFSPKGNKIAIGTINDADTAAIWDFKRDQLTMLPLVANAYSIAFDHTGSIVATGDDKACVTLWNAKTGCKLSELLGHHGIVNALAFNPVNDILASGGTDTVVKLWRYNKKSAVCSLLGHDDSVVCLAFQRDGCRLASISLDGSTGIWNIHTKSIVAHFVQLASIDFATILPSGYYTSSLRATDGIAFRVGDNGYYFDQYDVRNNRPDLVLQQFGSQQNDPLVQEYWHAYLKRLQTLNISRTLADFETNAPRITYLNAPSSEPLRSKQLLLQISASDINYTLDYIRIFVNGVPCFSSTGIDIRNRHARSLVITLPSISLSVGENRIETSVVNSQGTESLRKPLLAFYDAPISTHNLFIVSVGINHYQQSGHDLNYAVSDAKALANYFVANQNNYNHVYNIILTNQSAKKINIVSITKKLFQQAREDDTVILFLSGHGQLVNNDFYFCCWNGNFNNPKVSGLSYESIYSLFDAISARQKLLLIDACQAGEVDLENNYVQKHSESSHSSTDTSPLGEIPVPSDYISMSQSFLLMQTLFCDLRRGNGTIVLVACSGLQESHELPEKKHGAFTYALLHGLATKHTRISDLRRYVTEEVLRMMGRAQVPTLRQDNMMNDFDLTGIQLSNPE